jgi:hypothetical protein
MAVSLYCIYVRLCLPVLSSLVSRHINDSIKFRHVVCAEQAAPVFVAQLNVVQGSLALILSRNLDAVQRSELVKQHRDG